MPQVSTGGEIRTGTNPHAKQIIKSQQATNKPHITAWIYLLLCAVFIMETYVKEFHQAEFELKIDTIIQQLRDKDCQRVEFLRGMLAAYSEIVETRKGWVKKQVDSYFK